MIKKQPRPGTWEKWCEDEEFEALLDSVFEDDDDG